ncbi:hypothetical protein TNCV_3232421 [Trichonephila clavipes]|nr:hypothetical protein TNCV_3232421 [Trichonephila clavipes]
MNKTQKTAAGLNHPTVPLEEIVAVDDDNLCTAPIIAEKDILEFVHGSKNIIDTDANDKDKMNNAMLVPTSSEVMNIMKRFRAIHILILHHSGTAGDACSSEAKCAFFGDSSGNRAGHLEKHKEKQ